MFGLELIPVSIGSKPAGDNSHTPGGKLPVLSTRLAVGYFPSQIASPSFEQYQIILLADRGTCA